MNKIRGKGKKVFTQFGGCRLITWIPNLNSRFKGEIEKDNSNGYVPHSHSQKTSCKPTKIGPKLVEFMAVFLFSLMIFTYFTYDSWNLVRPRMSRITPTVLFDPRVFFPQKDFLKSKKGCRFFPLKFGPRIANPDSTILNLLREQKFKVKYFCVILSKGKMWTMKKICRVFRRNQEPIS